jgi:predicted amidohydrolase
MDHPSKKTRYAVDENAVGTQQQVTLSSGQLNPSSYSTPSETSPKSKPRLLSVEANATALRVPTIMNYAASLSPPSKFPVAARFDSRPMLLPLHDMYRNSGISTNNTTDPQVISTPSVVNICALQLTLRAPQESAWDAMFRTQRQMENIAASDMVDIFVLPELAPIGYSDDTFAKYLPINPTNQALHIEFDRLFQVTARKLHVYVCYGTIGWSYENCTLAMVQLGVPRLFIRQIVIDRFGTQVACYDKTYLSNYGDREESRYFQQGPASVPTSFPVYSKDRKSIFRFGLSISSDIRYANLSRTLVADAEHKVDCILQPAAFPRDCSFRSWSSFRETRAVENSVYWVGVNYAGLDHGDTSIVPPLIDQDHEPITLECDEGYLIGRVSRSTLDRARTEYPFYRQLLMDTSVNLQK